MIPLVSTRGRGIEALKLAIDRCNENVELVHYAQPRCSTKQIHWQK